MTPDIILVMVLLLFGFIMFVTEMFSIDVTAMILLTILFMLGYLTPSEALSGFSNPAVITIAFLKDKDFGISYCKSQASC
jgi:hypothetical protein